MNQSNSERSGELRQSIVSALIPVCQQKLKFAESVHIAGCLSFTIDNDEVLHVIFSKTVGPSLTSVPAGIGGDVPPPSLTKPETPSQLIREGQIQRRNYPEEVVDAQLNTRGQNDGLQSADDDKTELKELVKTTELFEIVPVVGICVPFSDPSVNIEPVHLVLNNHSLPSEQLAKETDNTVTEGNSRDDSKKLYSCSFCDFTTDDAGIHSSHIRSHKGVPSRTCVTYKKTFASSAELRRHVTQVHPQLILCPKCPLQFSTSVEVNNHMKLRHGVNAELMPCQSCSQRFITSELLQEHVRSKHRKVCTICNEAFTEPRKLMAHRLTEHPEAEFDCVRCGHRCASWVALRKHTVCECDHSRYKCDTCEKRFTSGSSLYHHRRTKHGDHKRYQCKVCGASFNFSNSLKVHMFRHDGLRPHQCTVCDKSYPTVRQLNNHVRVVHDESNLFPCSTCGKYFSTESHLRLHRTVHSGERPFACSFCDKSFVSSSALSDHQGSHRESAAYACDGCHKSFMQASSLRQHRRRHMSNGKQFICDVCGQRFKERGALKIHFSVHSSVRPYACKTCDKTYKTSRPLRVHLLTHQPSSIPFICAKCGKSFKMLKYLQAHEKRHLNKRTFVCHPCNKAFPYKGALKRHSASVHAPEPRYACPVCGWTSNQTNHLRMHMKRHGNPELLKLSNQDLAIAKPK